MKSIIQNVRDFYRRDANPAYYALVLFMLSVILYFNYPKLPATAIHSWAYHFIASWLLYFIPFALAFILQQFFYPDVAFFRNKWFLAILFLAPAVFAFRVNDQFITVAIAGSGKSAAALLLRNCTKWILGVIILAIPGIIFWKIKDSDQPLYGSRKIKSLRPYFTMLLVMLPLILLACTQKDFLHQYPRARVIGVFPIKDLNGALSWLTYELCYGLDFFSIEFFFRGFLILSLMRICGTHCIIPVACFYFTIHLGKPMGEAISSVFGGILLGIIAYVTRSIRGGIIVHLGIAWMMEICAWAAGMIIIAQSS